MRYTDSTKHTTTLDCFRKRYWFAEYGGRGIVIASPAEHFVYGQSVHTGVEELQKGTPFEEAFQAAFAGLLALDQSALTPDNHRHIDELGALLYGHLRAYADYVLPSLRERFEFLGSEQELVLPLSDEVTYLTRPDNIVRDKRTDLKFNINYKTSQYVNDLRTELETSLQLMMEAEAVRQHLGIQVAGTIIIGFDKGRYYSVSDREKDLGLVGKRLLSPLTYLYAKGDDPWNPATQYSTEYKNGWKRVPTWTGALTPQRVWESILPDDIKMTRVIELPPIYHCQERIEAVKKQILSVELNLAAADGNLDGFFPQNFKNCNKDGGYQHQICSYKCLCWDGESPDMLIGGLMKWREANHPIEENALSEFPV